MSEPFDPNPSANSLARRALFYTLTVGWLGAALGVLGARLGFVAGRELVLVLSSLLFSTCALGALLLFRSVALQTIATVSTICFAINLCAGMMIAVFGSGEHLNLFVYLVWFFPLLVFNKLVNQPTIARFLEKFLLIAPLLTVAGLAPRLISIFNAVPLTLLAVYCLSYLGYGTMFNIIMRYREVMVAERERIESLKIQSEVLASISDCFISLDAASKLTYLNDAACAEFGVDRNAALNDTLSNVAPGFFSRSMRSGMEAASSGTSATLFEAQNATGDIWYLMRCYPRPHGLSVNFRNITESILSRHKLDEAHMRLREQADLLDKARNGIFVIDTDLKVSYWNKGAERLYGWTSEEVVGRPVGDIFQHEHAELSGCFDSVLRDGEWFGELLQHRNDGAVVAVESHCTLINEAGSEAQSILAINTDITTRKAAEARIEHMAFYDALTGLPNRQFVRERLENAFIAAAHRGSMGALLLIDLDDFRTLNDTLGHDSGDHLLQQIALRLIPCVLAPDTLARLDGDEFAILLEGLSGDSRIAVVAAKTAAEKVLDAFREPYTTGSKKNDMTASIGIALFNGSSDTVDNVLKHADLAMYQAKTQGTNTMCFFDTAMQIFAESRAALRSDLRKALQNREFMLHYQPQVNSRGRVMSAEALLRWRHPLRGMVSPAQFIPLAEEAGLIVELGRWVLETACSQVAKWSTDPRMESLTISVNVSLLQFLDPNFVGIVLEVLRKSGVNPHRIKLELTESSMIEKVEETISKIEALRMFGIGFSLDDFGTGYSSLSHLRRLPLDQLKVDRSFVLDLLVNDKDASIARTIIALGKNLELSVIAEGVETEEQRQFLEGAGCHLYQGFLFSAALPSEEFEAFVTRQ